MVRKLVPKIRWNENRKITNELYKSMKISITNQDYHIFILYYTRDWNYNLFPKSQPTLTAWAKPSSNSQPKTNILIFSSHYIERECKSGKAKQNFTKNQYI